ncbi:signal peptide peptidase SppA, 67K type [Rippkaea orientalis PCC 8801]|uniref:Protease 4 n=1 Tax=Rippkaea orientalis (strain PCC 8801 / RF-1) TaxID=41431 RepID=B7K128_RIPO1|nr:signal peptide peptidase SppA [Rippkaea orientalis]ACK65169.1 signal peptide peptidase SppA, 67K type [Rippkaea orientalis PCC 8801]
MFFKQTLASLIGTLAGLFLFMTIGVSGLVILLISLASLNTSPTIKDKSVLVFDLSTQVQDTEPPLTLSDVFSDEDQSVLTLRQVLQGIEKATKDDRIQAIFLDGSTASGGSGYGTFSEIREALAQFREAGKKIIVYDVTLSEQEYYLSALADTVILNPMGQMELKGLAIEPLFWSGTFDKYGIGVQTVRVGSFKGAIEPFTRKDLSPENRQQLQALLDDLWSNFLVTVGKNREVSPQILQRLANNQGILTAQQALEVGLVDEVGYQDQAIAKLKELTGTTNSTEKSFPQVTLGTYLNVPVLQVPERSSSQKIAVVYLEGAIVDGLGTLQQVGGSRFANLLRQIRQDETIKAVVIRINSPGGSATASDIILREIQLTQAEKPVIISMGNVAASGGYWVATGGQHIFAQANTVTGSIGVFGLFLNINEIANNNGLSWDTVKTANFGDLGTATRPKTPQELAIYQGFVNQVYDLFLERVAKSRQLSKTKVNEIAQGRIWSGEDAKTIGLVDSIGGLNAAINYAAQQAKLGTDWQLDEYPQRRGLESLFIRNNWDSNENLGQTSTDPLTKELIKFKDELTTLRSLNDPKGVYSRLPFNWPFH